MIARRRQPISRPSAIRGLIGAVEEAIALTEQAVKVWKEAGVNAAGTSPEAKMLAQQEVWLAQQRRGLALMHEEEPFTYRPE